MICEAKPVIAGLACNDIALSTLGKYNIPSISAYRANGAPFNLANERKNTPQSTDGECKEW